ncbi:MAG: hypothetical protein E4H08_05420 [Candidatus Atribacteria bacterium]|nr:MAG: hypothetical protein E4H08_05420 [Candidatus Atribacteria bacterium]
MAVVRRRRSMICSSTGKWGVTRGISLLLKLEGNMRLAVISDVHLGDPDSSMAGRSSSSENVMGHGYDLFQKSIHDQFRGEPLDYLVLLGDILDFSIEHYSLVYEIGRAWFGRMIEDKILRRRPSTGDESRCGPIIYISGNHDVDMWHTVEYQVSIIRRLSSGEKAEKFRMSVPTIIHERPDKGVCDVYLHGVNNIVDRRYGGLFLDFITSPPTDFYFGYPNLYFVSEGETVMMTHGQYFNFFWSFLGQWAVKIVGDDLKLSRRGQLDLVEMVGINCPTSQLSCSAIGQAGPLTDVIRKLEHDIKAHQMGDVNRYLDRLLDELLSTLNSGLLRIPGAKWGIHLVIKSILKRLLGKTKSARDYQTYLDDRDVKENFDEFYKATIREIEDVQQDYPFEIPYPSRMIFGHTHQPVSWHGPGDIAVPGCSRAAAGRLLVSNTGGWLCHKDKQGPGAEIFYYETGKGFTSKRIHYEPGGQPIQGGTNE